MSCSAADWIEIRLLRSILRCIYYRIECIFYVGRACDTSDRTVCRAVYDAVEDTALSLAELFNQYIVNGSFPYILKYGYQEKEAREYMSGIYNTILLNDVVRRLKNADVNMLEAVARFLLFNIGNRTSPAVIANTMTSNHRKIDPKTVDRYIRGLTDSHLLYEARRYNIKGKQFLETQNKYYVCDVGMRNMLVRGTDADTDHILENIVFLELKRRYGTVYVG